MCRLSGGEISYNKAPKMDHNSRGRRQDKPMVIEDDGRDEIWPFSVKGTNEQQMNQLPIARAEPTPQSPNYVQKSAQNPEPTMSRAQALSPWSQCPVWPPGYFLAESLRKPNPWAIYDQPPRSLDVEQLPSETLSTSRKRSSDAVQDQLESSNTKRPRADTGRLSSRTPNMGSRDGGSGNRYVGRQHRTANRWPRKFSGELMSEKELRAHILGYPPRDQPMPEGLLIEDKIRYWPNHLHGKLLLEITDGVWGLKPTEIARIFGGDGKDNPLKANTLVKRIAKLREARDAGHEIL